MALSYPTRESIPPKILVVNSGIMRGFIVAVLILVGVLIAYQLARQDMQVSTRMAILLGYMVGVPLLLSANYERSIIILFGFGSIAGLLKFKTGFDPIIHVSLDIILILICISWLLRKFVGKNIKGIEWTPLGGLIVYFVLSCLIQIFNPYSYNYIASVASLKMHIGMIPLYFFGYHLLHSKNQIKHWYLVFTIIGLMVAAVSIFQFQQGPEKFIEENPEAATLVYQNTWIAEGKLYFRPPSTTTNAGGASTWDQVIIPLALSLLLVKGVSRWIKIIVLVSIVVMFQSIFISLVRQMLIVTIIGIILMVLLQFRAGQLGRGIAGIILFGGLIIVGFQFASKMASGAMADRLSVLSNPLQAYQKSRGHQISYLRGVAQLYPLGAGLGRTGPAAAKFGKEIKKYWQRYGGPGTFSSDNYFAVMIVETGYPGLLGILGFTLAVLFKGYGIYRRLWDPDLKWIAVGILAMHVSIFITWMGGAPLLSTPQNLFFWFLSGVLLKLPQLDLAEQTQPAKATT